MDSLRRVAEREYEARRGRRYVPRVVQVRGRTYKLTDVFGCSSRHRWPTEYSASFRDHFREMVSPQRRGSGNVVDVDDEAAKLDAQAQTGNVDGQPGRNEVLLDEIVERRKRANEYREHARGSHFSRQHAAQLLSHHRARCWDAPPRNVATQIRNDADLERDAQTETNANDEEPSNEPTQNEPETDEPEADERRDEAVSADLSARETDLRPTRIPSNADGRVPTSRLADLDERHVQRHHLDRTTPISGRPFFAADCQRYAAGRGRFAVQHAAHAVRRCTLFRPPR